MAVFPSTPGRPPSAPALGVLLTLLVSSATLSARPDPDFPLLPLRSQRALPTRAERASPEPASPGPTWAEETAPAPNVFDDVVDALTGGEAYFKMRIRAEHVDMDGFSKDADAFTARTVVGYETKPYQGFTAMVEFENISAPFGETYNDTVNGKTDRPVIADPTTTEVNQAYVQTRIADLTQVRAGRQRIVMDNARFIGDVAWRQNHQTYDAVTLVTDMDEDTVLTYGYMTNANRVVGEDNPGGDARMDSHFLNLGLPLGEDARLIGYWYYLDFDRDSVLIGQATSTVGARLTGAAPLGDEQSLTYAVEFATQDDIGGNPNDVNANYMLAELGTQVGDGKILVAQERLEGSNGNPANNVDAFSTPLATLAKFNGWADQFLATPAGGLEDTYISFVHPIGDATLKATAHNFQAEASGRDYGYEFDLTLTQPLSERSSWGAQVADYNARKFSEDTFKAWLWLSIWS